MPETPVLSIARRADRFAPQAKGPRDRSGGRSRHPARRKGRRRGRERVGQDTDHAFGAPAPAEITPDPGRSDRFQRPESDRSRRAGDRDDTWRRDCDGLSGPDDLAEPALASTYPGCRDAAQPRLQRVSCPRADPRGVESGGFRRPRTSRGGVSARALGRDGPEGDDRDGDCHLAAPPRGRRADHRPRRHNPAANPRPRRFPSSADRHVGRLGHPRPECDRGPRRPGVRDVRGAHCRASTDRATIQPAGSPVLASAPGLAARAKDGPPYPAHPDRRFSARPGPLAGGLSVPGSLPITRSTAAPRRSPHCWTRGDGSYAACWKDPSAWS